MMTTCVMNSLVEEIEKEGVFIKPFEIRKILDIIKRIELKSSDDKEKVAIMWNGCYKLKNFAM